MDEVVRGEEEDSESYQPSRVRVLRVCLHHFSKGLLSASSFAFDLNSGPGPKCG